jgi:hypothetical protein
MPADIVAAADETAFTKLLHDSELALGTQTAAGAGDLGPFNASYSASINFTGGSVTLSPPNVVHINNLHLNYSLSFSFSLNLNDFLPHFCLPRVCVHIPFIGTICTPKICVSWPTITVPVNYADTVVFSSDFAIIPHAQGPNWLVDVKILGFPNINLSPAAAAILSALGFALGAVLLAVPFIGPFLAGLVIIVLNTIAIAGVTGLLGPLITPFVSGLTFNVYKQPKHFRVLPPSGGDPAVFIDINALDAVVEATNKKEFVLTADI